MHKNYIKPIALLSFIKPIALLSFICMIVATIRKVYSIFWWHILVSLLRLYTRNSVTFSNIVGYVEIVILIWLLLSKQIV